MNQLSTLSDKIKSLLVTAFLLITFHLVRSQSITIDSSFNGTGRLITDYRDLVSSRNFRLMNVSTLAIQEDGKIVIGGTKTDSLLICRYNINGTADSSFGNYGIAAIFNFIPYANPLRIRILPNGKIMVLARDNDIKKYCFYRFLSDGIPDKDFGQNGKTIFDLPSQGAVIDLMEIQVDGKILMAGNTEQSSTNWPGFYMIRFNSGGSIDNSFGNAGEVKTLFNFIKDNPLNGEFYNGGASIADIVIQGDGKIIACGTMSSSWNGYILSDSIAIVRYNTDGSLDNSFNNNGKFSFDVPNINNPGFSGTFANSICLQPDGEIVVGGGLYSSQSHGQWRSATYTMLRLLPNGRPDSTFDGDGVKIFINDWTNGFYNMCVKTFVQADGKVLLLGNLSYSDPNSGTYNPEIMLTRLNNAGEPDNNFGSAGLWQPAYYNNSGERIICPASNALIKGQRIYVFGNSPDQYDNGPWGTTIFAFKIDGIAAYPKTRTICAQGTATTIIADLPGNNYQWQVSTDGINFNSIINDAHYSGVNTPLLSINNIYLNWNSNKYRCVTENSIGNVTTLRFLENDENEWVGTQSSAWEDPVNWLCGTVPDNNSTVIISSGNVIIHSNVTIKNIQLLSGASLTVDTGFSLILK